MIPQYMIDGGQQILLQGYLVLKYPSFRQRLVLTIEKCSKHLGL